MPNSVDLDETARSEPSHLDLCCMQKPVIIACGSELIVLKLNDTSTLLSHFVSSPREREKRDRRGDREGKGRKRNMNESKETEEIKTSPLYPYQLKG